MKNDQIKSNKSIIKSRIQDLLREFTQKQMMVMRLTVMKRMYRQKSRRSMMRPTWTHSELWLLTQPLTWWCRTFRTLPKLFSSCRVFSSSSGPLCCGVWLVPTRVDTFGSVAGEMRRGRNGARVFCNNPNKSNLGRRLTCSRIFDDCVLYAWRFWMKTHKAAKELKNKDMDPARDWTLVSRVTQVGDDNRLQQTRHHKGQAQRQKHIWANRNMLFLNDLCKNQSSIDVIMNWLVRGMESPVTGSRSLVLSMKTV